MDLGYIDKLVLDVPLAVRKPMGKLIEAVSFLFQQSEDATLYAHWNDGNTELSLNHLGWLELDFEDGPPAGEQLDGWDEVDEFARRLRNDG